MNNEINATYMKNEKKINLLHNYDLTEDLIYEVKESYIEAQKDINSENVEIFVNGKKINFDFYYSSNEIGEIKVKFKFKKLLVNTSYLFYNCSCLKLIDLSSFKTGEIKSMISMFENCSSLESLDLVSFNTSNVQNMSCMFRNCSSLKKINLSLFETNKVKDISYMFMDCSSLNSIDLSSFNTDEVKNMSHIFESCSSLTSINISSFKTKESTNVWNMFEGCSSLKKEKVIMDPNDENISKELSYLN
jgi:surface protein